MSQSILKGNRARNDVRHYGLTLLGVVIALAIIVVLVGLYFVNAAATGPSAAQARIQTWVNQLSDEQLTPSRHLAQQQLEKAGEASVDPLIAALHSPNASLRRNSAEMLGFIGSTRALESLMVTLANDPVASVRSRAAWALGELHDLRAVNALERASVSDQNPQVRLEASGSIDALRSHLAEEAAKNERLVDTFAVAPDQPNVVYLAEMNQISISRDGGKTWNPAASTLPSRVTALAVSPSNPNILYAGTESLGLYESADGGVTWIARNQGLGLEPGMRLTVTALTIDPRNPDRVYAAKGTWIGTSRATLVPLGIMLSLDGGETWQKVDMLAPQAAITRLVIIGNGLYALVNDEIISLSL
jgi:hypothetical protein